MNLSEKDKQYYFSLKKGYEGEKLFDLLTEKLKSECLILNDLLLQQNNTVFQIDSLVIFREALYFFEVKNYEGDFYYDSDRLFKTPNSEINNPLNQLNRSESMLRQFLQNLGYQLPIKASVVFINPEFTLYQAPLNKPFIFPTQINRFLKQLDMIPSKLRENHKVLAEQLVSLHINESPFTRLPSYEYNHLRKGITCAKCTSFSIFVEGRNCVCKECGHEEIVSDAVMRNVEEFQLLFPYQKITTNIIHDWCQVVPSKKRIRKILKNHFEIVGVHQWAYYKKH